MAGPHPELATIIHPDDPASFEEMLRHLSAGVAASRAEVESPAERAAGAGRLLGAHTETPEPSSPSASSLRRPTNHSACWNTWPLTPLSRTPASAPACSIKCSRTLGSKGDTCRCCSRWIRRVSLVCGTAPQTSPAAFLPAQGCMVVDQLEYLLPLAGKGLAPLMDLMLVRPAIYAHPKAHLREWLTVVFERVYGTSPHDPHIDRMMEPVPDPIGSFKESAPCSLKTTPRCGRRLAPTPSFLPLFSPFLR